MLIQERGFYKCAKNTRVQQQQKVLGAYGSQNDSKSNITNMHQVLILGDGHILCNNAMLKHICRRWYLGQAQQVSDKRLQQSHQ